MRIVSWRQRGELTMATKKERRIAWFLRAPGCALAIVTAQNFEQATIKAAEFWGVPWREIASNIEVERTVEQKPNVCTECGTVYSGASFALCERCRARRRAEHDRMREAAIAYRQRERLRKEKKKR